MTKAYRVSQNQRNYTAPIVLETARRVAESDEDIQVTLIHDEEPYWNLGYTQKPLVDVSPELQDHRFCGGGAVLHDNTYCFMEGSKAPGEKENIDSDRRDSAQRFLKILEETEDYDNAYFFEDGELYDPASNSIPLEVPDNADIIYFAPGGGDIYEAEDHGHPNPLTDKQIAGAGFPQIEIELENETQLVNLSRFCVYREEPDEKAEEIYPEKDPHFQDWDAFLEGIRTVDNIENLMRMFEDQSPKGIGDELFAERSFTEARGIIDDRQWELRNGSGRNTGSCF